MKILASLLLFISSSTMAAFQAQNTHALALQNECTAAKKAVNGYYALNDHQAADEAGLTYATVVGRGPDCPIVATRANSIDCVIQGGDVTVTIQNIVYADLGLGGRSGQYPALENIRKTPQVYTRKIRVKRDEGKWKLNAHDLYPQFTYMSAAVMKFSEAKDACQGDSEKVACLKEVNQDLLLLKQWRLARHHQ